MGEPERDNRRNGLPGIGIRIKTDKESLVFSSDTVNDDMLWKQLYTEKREQWGDNKEP